MNIEDSIEILKNMILMPDGWIIGKDYKGNLEFIGCFEGQEAIETLLTAYEKEKGENVKLRLQDIPLIEGELKAYKDRVNELKQELEKEKEKNKELTDEYLVQRDLINPDFLKDYVSKDKIKAKIEEYKQNVKDFEEYWSKDIRKFPKTKCIDYYKLEALQSLLEKE